MDNVSKIKHLLTVLAANVLLVLLVDYVKHRLLHVWFPSFSWISLTFDKFFSASGCNPACQNGGQCQQTITNTYACVCPPEYTGNQCETSVLGKNFLFFL